MIQCIRAVFENGVLRPLESLRLEDHAEVRVTVELDNGASPAQLTEDPFDEVRFDGPADLAERFDEYRFGRANP